MSSSSFFLFSFAGPIVSGGLMALATWLAKDWLQEHSVPPLPIIFVAFIIGWILSRKLIHYFVAVECPKCNKATAYEMDAVACRFRCTVCWKEF